MNPYDTMGEITYLYLLNKKGKRFTYVLIDTEDLEKVLQYHWGRTGRGYVETVITKDKQRKHLKMHHLILGYPKKGLQVDHKNKDTLDNRKDNLRFCTHSENQHNAQLRKDNISGYQGVFYHKASRKWVAQLNINKKQTHLGLFNTPEEAAIKRTIIKAQNDNSKV